MELTQDQLAAIIAEAVSKVVSAPAPEPVVSAPATTSAGQAMLAKAAEAGIVIDPARLATEGSWLVGCHYAGDACKDEDGRVRRFKPHGIGSALHPCNASAEARALFSRWASAKRTKDTASAEAIESLAAGLLGLDR